MSKVWNKLEIERLLSGSDKACVRALMAIYRRQTESEKEAQKTVLKNGKGFSSMDAGIFTSLAESYLKYKKLTDKQVLLLRGKGSKGQSRIGKYWRQLLEVAEENGYKVDYSDSPLAGWSSTVSE